MLSANREAVVAMLRNGYLTDESYALDGGLVPA
jgi:hypothetical protein